MNALLLQLRYVEPPAGDWKQYRGHGVRWMGESSRRSLRGRSAVDPFDSNVCALLLQNHYVCIEPGYVKEFKTLQPGEEWIGQQVLSVVE